MTKGPLRTFRRWAVALMVALPVIWFLGWYVASFDYDDCVGALRQIRLSDSALYRVTQSECATAGSVRHYVETFGLALLALAELALWRVTRRKIPQR